MEGKKFDEEKIKELSKESFSLVDKEGKLATDAKELMKIMR